MIKDANGEEDSAVKRNEFFRVRESLKNKQSDYILINADGKQYVREWKPKERLILLGGGHIAQPLCDVGAMLNFDVTVADDRPYFANKIRFPKAENIVCDNFEKAVDNLKINGDDYVCIITRGHRYDAECLRKILSGTMPHYLGMIGSRRRVSALKELLLTEGFDSEALDRLNAPIGSPIHAETTAEIAISIAAQLIEYRRGSEIKEGTLKEKNIDTSVLDALCSEDEWVLAVVLETKGSTPVKSGAVMAVNALGQTRGTVGGGCSEGEVISIARQMVGTKGKRVVCVDMTNDVAEEEGMVCGGTMRVLLECVSGLSD
jgi:xanthine dehydrogenase accessory factor